MCVFVTCVPTFRLESDMGGELMCSDKADLKSSKVQVDNNVIWEVWSSYMSEKDF